MCNFNALKNLPPHWVHLQLPPPKAARKTSIAKAGSLVRPISAAATGQVPTAASIPPAKEAVGDQATPHKVQSDVIQERPFNRISPSDCLHERQNTYIFIREDWVREGGPGVVYDKSQKA